MKHQKILQRLCRRAIKIRKAAPWIDEVSLSALTDDAVCTIMIASFGREGKEVKGWLATAIIQHRTPSLYQAYRTTCYAPSTGMLGAIRSLQARISGEEPTSEETR